MKRRCFLQVVTLGSVIFAVPLAAQRPSDFSALEKTIQAELAETRTPGAAVAIVSGNQIVFAKGFGTSNSETGAPVTPDMLFRIGSVTKMFTTTALTLLAEQGKLSLDVPIGQYMKGLSLRLSQVSAHQLMSHTSGLRDEAPSYGAHDAEALARVIRAWNDHHFFTASGRVFSYSNPGFAVAGLLAEEVSGRPYARLLDETLFKPLGMNTTTFEPTLAMTYPLSQGHNVGDEKTTVVRPFADNAGYWPAGFLFSSANDLARFAIACMNGGRIDGKSVIPPVVFTKLSTGYAPTHSGPENAAYGYGLLTREYRGVRVIEHGGSIQGFGAQVRMVPEQQFAIITLSNRSGGQLPKTMSAAMDMFLPLKALGEDKMVVAAPQFTAGEISSLPGRYSQGPTAVEIVARNGKLFFKQGTLEAPLHKISDARIVVAGPQRREFVIVRGSNGRVEYLHASMRALARQP
ncbi:MAG: serine hydrolase domain-containing protein [Longimicrobiales bacterium]